MQFLFQFALLSLAVLGGSNALQHGDGAGTDVKKAKPDKGPNINGFGTGFTGPGIRNDVKIIASGRPEPAGAEVGGFGSGNAGPLRRDAGTPIATAADGVNLGSIDSGLAIHDVALSNKASQLVLTFSPLLTDVLCGDTFDIVIEVKQGSSSGTYGDISTVLGGQGTGTPLNVTFVCGSSSPNLTDPGANLDLIVFVPANVVLNIADTTDAQNILSTVELIDLENNQEYTASMNLQAWVQSSNPNPPITFLGLAQP